MVNKHWHILNIDSSFKERLNSSELMIAFRKTTSLRESIGTNTKRNNQKFLAPNQTTTAGQCTPCYTIDCFAANTFSKQQHLQAPKPDRPLQSFTKSLTTVTMSSTYKNASCARFSMLGNLKHYLISD